MLVNRPKVRLIGYLGKDAAILAAAAYFALHFMHFFALFKDDQDWHMPALVLLSLSIVLIEAKSLS